MNGLTCSCGSLQKFGDCCGPYLSGEKLAPTAEALMRSRYTAYVRRDARHLLRTWHPKTRPKKIELQHDTTQWLGLRIRDVQAGTETDNEGIVEFAAEFQVQKEIRVMIERSHFVKSEQGWLYVDGADPTKPSAPQKVGRNEPCPCQSGKKYKQCCGKSS